jgi:putative transposase
MSFFTLFFYVSYGVSYRDLEAIMEERGVIVDHSTLNHWFSITHLPWLWQLKKLNVLLLLRGGWMKPISKSKGNGYIYIEPLINSVTPLIFILSKHRDEAAVTAFFKQAIDANGFPKRVVMDKGGGQLCRSGAY